MARTMRASSSHVHGCTFDEPRNAIANPEHRDVRRARHLGCVSLVTLFSQEKRVTRSAEGRAEALHLNDKPKKARGWIPAFAGMTSESKELNSNRCKSTPALSPLAREGKLASGERGKRRGAAVLQRAALLREVRQPHECVAPCLFDVVRA